MVKSKYKLRNLFTKKQLEVIKQVLTNKDFKLMINHGAVRSGKTFVDNFVFLFEILFTAIRAKADNVRRPKYILAGVSSKTIANNILSELDNVFGISVDFDVNNSFTMKFKGLPPVSIVQAYTGNKGGIGGIRGMTAYGAYINEASLADEEVFKEIRKRCSAPGARVVCDTNPDVPTHWLKQYIDMAQNSKFILANQFVIDDNLENLDPAYVKSLKDTTPSGAMYDRDILGKWVSGEGLIYKDFNNKDNIISRKKFNEIKQHHKLTYYCGVDWGFAEQHKNVIVVLADDELGNTYMIEEHTDTEQPIEHWVEVAKNIRSRFGTDIPFYCDSARPDMVYRFKNVEHFNAMNAYKSVLTGISEVARKIKSNSFMIVDDCVEYVLKEMYQYSWDKKTGSVSKHNDDVMDAIRYAIATRLYLLQSKKQHGTNRQTKEETVGVLKQFGMI